MQSLSHLEHLDFSDCNAFTPPNSQPIRHLRQLRSLKLLRLRNCAFLDDNGLQQLVLDHGDSLQVLDIYGCDNISDEGARWLQRTTGLLVLTLGNDRGILQNISFQAIQPLAHLLSPDCLGTQIVRRCASDEMTDFSDVEDDDW